MLESLISSKTRVRLLVKFFTNIANRGYLNGLANEFGESTNSVRKELNNLSSAGYLEKRTINNKVVYNANVNHPLFNTLHKIVREHLGLDLIIQNILKNIGSFRKIVLLGDYAKGIDSGVIEILIIGSEINQKYLDDIKIKIESKISRKIVFFISSDVPDQHHLVLFEV